MIVRESVPLSSLTTLRVGGTARYVVEVQHPIDLLGALTFARERSLSYVVLGEGSNVLASDEGYDGLVICMRTSGVTYTEKAGVVEVTAQAGVAWDALVSETVNRGLWGLENLAGIPGTVGAAPVQNIGAYGVELERAVHTVRVYDTTTDTEYSLSRDDCQFGYRQSRFKTERNLIITEVIFHLEMNGMPHTSYTDLTRAKESGVSLSSPREISEAVRAIRAKKFPDLTREGSAGSFFKNPIITTEAYAALQERYPELPQYPAVGGVKIPLAYVLDRVLNLRGYRIGKARLFEAQPLVLVTDSDASADDVERLAHDVEQKVFSATNILVEREVQSLK